MMRVTDEVLSPARGFYDFSFFGYTRIDLAAIGVSPDNPECVLEYRVVENKSEGKMLSIKYPHIKHHMLSDKYHMRTTTLLA